MHPDCRYYARGVFAWPLIATTCSWSYQSKSWKGKLFQSNAGVLSLIDWPVRWDAHVPGFESLACSSREPASF
jgi:hypothetical protein